MAQHNTRRTLAAAFVLTAITAVTPSAFADPAKDLQVAARALGFLESAPSGNVVLGIVFDPGKPATLAERDALMAAIGGGMAAGDMKITGTPIEASKVGSASGVAALYVTTGVNYAEVGAAASGKKLLTISGDKACAQAGQCVMSVVTSPAVEITVNHNAAAAVGASFKAAFRMMIHEV
ncbi:MAG TPA: hypothetical protein VLW26_10380 [Steroidobacteraceae bacterium]|nr:hypothetical protein [Steroidobacteraceae bacterium]